MLVEKRRKLTGRLNRTGAFSGFDLGPKCWHIAPRVMSRCRGHVPELDAPLLGEIVRRVVAAASPEKIVLFGSRARGDHRPDSDIDLLIIQESPLRRHRRSLAVYAALSELPLEVDTEIVVYTPQEVREWSGASAAFVTTALREGRVLYEK